MKAGARALSGRKRLNESPSEKEGKYKPRPNPKWKTFRLNESPSEKEGK